MQSVQFASVQLRYKSLIFLLHTINEFYRIFFFFTVGRPNLRIEKRKSLLAEAKVPQRNEAWKDENRNQTMKL